MANDGDDPPIVYANLHVLGNGVFRTTDCVAPDVMFTGVVPAACDILVGYTMIAMVFPVAVTFDDAGPRFTQVVPASGDHCSCAFSVGEDPDTVPQST